MKISHITAIYLLTSISKIIATDTWSTPEIFSGYTTYTRPAIVYLDDNTVTNIWGMTSFTIDVGSPNFYERLELGTYQPENLPGSSWYNRDGGLGGQTYNNSPTSIDMYYDGSTYTYGISTYLYTFNVGPHPGPSIGFNTYLAPSGGVYGDWTDHYGDYLQLTYLPTNPLSQTAIDGSGYAYIAYVNNTTGSSGGDQIVVNISTDQAGGVSWPTFPSTTELNINIYEITDLQLQTLKVASTRFAILSWKQNDGSGNKSIWASTYDGSSWSSPTALATGTGTLSIDSSPIISIDQSNTNGPSGVVGWAQTDSSSGTDQQIGARYFNDSGGWTPTWTTLNATTGTVGFTIYPPGLYLYGTTAYISYENATTLTNIIVNKNTIGSPTTTPSWLGSSTFDTITSSYSLASTAISGDSLNNFMLSYVDANNDAYSTFYTNGSTSGSNHQTIGSGFGAPLSIAINVFPVSTPGNCILLGSNVNDLNKLYFSQYPYTPSPPPPSPPPPSPPPSPPSPLNTRHSFPKINGF